MTEQEHIHAKAIRERLLFKKYLKNAREISFGFKYTPYNGTEQHDLTYRRLCVRDWKASKVMSEIKARECSLYSINSGGFLIEKTKYDYLMSNANEYDVLEYICFFPEGILIWDLKKCTIPTWTYQEQRKNNQSNNTKEKEVGYLMFWECEYDITTPITITQTLKQSYAILQRINNKENKSNAQ